MALKNLEILENEGADRKFPPHGRLPSGETQGLAGHPIVGEVRGLGLWAALELTRDRSHPRLLPRDSLVRLVDRAKGKGPDHQVHGQARSSLPPLIIQPEHIDWAIWRNRRMSDGRGEGAGIVKKNGRA